LGGWKIIIGREIIIGIGVEVWNGGINMDIRIGEMEEREEREESIRA
jgi:hypothetical protein